MHAEVSNDLECDDARQGPVQAEGHRLRRTGFPFKGAFALDFQDSCCTLCWQELGKEDTPPKNQNPDFQ